MQLLGTTRRSLLLAAGVLSLPGVAHADSETDVSSARLSASVERLLNAYWARALASGTLAERERAAVEQMRRNDRAHYAALATVIGPTVPTDDDLEFVFAADAFSARRDTLALGVRLTGIALSAHLGGVAAVGDRGLRSLLGRIAAAESRHHAALVRMAGGNDLSDSLPRPLAAAEASDALAPYLQ
jgi:Ferritin-like domain